MRRLLVPSSARRAIRRATPLYCEAVSLDRYRILAVQALDVSASGLLVSAEEMASPKELVLVHLFDGERDIVAEAEVARIVRGRRDTDQGAALGLRLTRAPSRRLERLLRRLRGTPPPVPARHLRVDYAASIRAASEGRDL